MTALKHFIKWANRKNTFSSLSDLLSFHLVFLPFYLYGLKWMYQNFLWLIPILIIMVILNALLRDLFHFALKDKNIKVSRGYFIFSAAIVGGIAALLR